MLKEVADFWASRVERKGPGRFEINNVIGANEWQENIDNNAFTNGMAITVLRYTTQAAKELGVVPDPDWEVVAQNIPILKFADGTANYSLIDSLVVAWNDGSFQRLTGVKANQQLLLKQTDASAFTKKEVPFV